MKKRDLTLILLLLSLFSLPARASFIFELKTGPETTREGALNFFNLSPKEYFEQDLISSLSAGFLAGGVLGLTVEGLARSPEYIDNRFYGTHFEKAYVNLFLELFILRIGAGADIESFSTASTGVQVFTGLVLKFSKKFSLLIQATGYGTYVYPADISFGQNVTLQFGFSLRTGQKKKKLLPWEDPRNPEWKTFWEDRVNKTMTGEKEPEEKPAKEYEYY
jgi:hypothetical protein